MLLYTIAKIYAGGGEGTLMHSGIECVVRSQQCIVLFATVSSHSFVSSAVTSMNSP